MPGSARASTHDLYATSTKKNRILTITTISIASSIRGDVCAAPYNPLRRWVFYEGSRLMSTIADFCVTQSEGVGHVYTDGGQGSESV